VERDPKAFQIHFGNHQNEMQRNVKTPHWRLHQTIWDGKSSYSSTQSWIKGPFAQILANISSHSLCLGHHGFLEVDFEFPNFKHEGAPNAFGT
jgi:hypothetical protein